MEWVWALRAPLASLLNYQPLRNATSVGVDLCRTTSGGGESWVVQKALRATRLGAGGKSGRV